MCRDDLTDEQRDKEKEDLHQFVLNYLEKQEQNKPKNTGTNYN